MGSYNNKINIISYNQSSDSIAKIKESKTLLKIFGLKTNKAGWATIDDNLISPSLMNGIMSEAEKRNQIIRVSAEITAIDDEKTEWYIASFFSNGENWGTQQEMLLIKQDKLMKALERSGYTPIWVFRVYKSPSSKSYERYPKILHDTDVTYLIWVEDEIKYMPLEELKPPIGAFDNGRS